MATANIQDVEPSVFLRVDQSYHQRENSSALTLATVRRLEIFGDAIRLSPVVPRVFFGFHDLVCFLSIYRQFRTLICPSQRRPGAVAAPAPFSLLSCLIAVVTVVPLVIGIAVDLRRHPALAATQ